MTARDAESPRPCARVWRLDSGPTVDTHIPISTYLPWYRVVLPARATRLMSGVAGGRRPCRGVRTLEKSVQLHGARFGARGVGLQASLVLLDLRFAAVLDGVDRGTARARHASSTRQGGVQARWLQRLLLCRAGTQRLLQLVARGVPAARVGVYAVDVCTEFGGAVPLHCGERRLHSAARTRPSRSSVVLARGGNSGIFISILFPHHLKKTYSS